MGRLFNCKGAYNLSRKRCFSNRCIIAFTFMNLEFVSKDPNSGVVGIVFVSAQSTLQLVYQLLTFCELQPTISRETETCACFPCKTLQTVNNGDSADPPCAAELILQHVTNLQERRCLKIRNSTIVPRPILKALLV